MRIVFFDGFCTICNSFVDWGLKIDNSQQIQFASLQGESAKQLLNSNYVENVDTVIYLRDGLVLQRSTAVLYFLKDTKSFFSILFLFLIVPAFLRDLIYNLFANSRYRLFRKRDICRVPNESEKSRLLK